MNKYKGLENIIGKNKIKYNESMKNYTTMRVGGTCDAIVFPNSIEEIKKIVEYCKKDEIKFYVIGNGSNLLVKDEGIHALIIKIGCKFNEITVKNDEIEVTAGVSMPIISQTAKKNALTGLEFACGIPGTIGGGIKMNAGAYGSELSNVVLSVTYLDEKLNIKTITNEECEFGYRKSIFSNNPNYIILGATFKLKKGNIEEIEKQMNENSLARKTKQPLEYPNFGSVFKRPEGYFVGKLVQDAGLKGYTIGGVQVSTKHTGFFVNIDKEKATCKDVLDLIEHVQNTVYEKFKVKLTPEVVIIGGEE